MTLISSQVKNGFINVAKGLGVTALVILSCPISVVAIPIIGAKTLIDFKKHQFLYQNTLTNQTRGLFGRLPNQDYTRWDGVSIQAGKTVLNESLRKHQSINLYVHGQNSLPLQPSSQSSFKTLEDIEWLDKEYTRRVKYDELQQDLKILRICLKALFPILGLFWAALTEELSDNANVPQTCTACNQQVINLHWRWQTAINFHRTHLRQQFGV